MVARFRADGTRCVACGARLPADARFCAECGRAVGAAE
jgi:predicted nucleic acid-binding Zn ribbon protein